MKNYYAAALLATALAVVSCKKEGTATQPPSANSIAPEGFNFSTTKQVSVDIKLLTNDDSPLSGVLVNVFSAPDQAAGSSLATILSAADGSVKATLTIPAYLDTLYIDPAYIGLVRNAKGVISGGSISGVIGGSQGLSGDILASVGRLNGYSAVPSVLSSLTARGKDPDFDYVPFDKSGRPTNLVSPSDKISSTLLSFINASLPEFTKVPTVHPEYLSSTVANDIRIVKSADLWVTFVSEGAGYFNSLGYYTYPTSTPPTSQEDIKIIKIIFPNASLAGSGGAMVSGDKLYLGRFEPGTSVGFVLLQDGFNENKGKVEEKANKWYTSDFLNEAESKESMKRHAVQLYDDVNKLFLTGFEDLTRSFGGSDEDFNDLVFYTSASLSDAISTANVAPIAKPNDADSDGVKDEYDQFPHDASRAYEEYFPSQAAWGTLAFEDMWPYTGDYDLNDMVLSYRYKYIKNAQNNTVELFADYALRAIGASFLNGFGVQLPVTFDKVSKVEGQLLKSNYISLNANGTEAGQKYAVYIPFDDSRALFKSGGFANVRSQSSHITGDTSRIYVKFTTALTSSELSPGFYNPFLIGNQRRGYEVHLPGQLATSKADTKLFGTQQDKTNIALGKYYLSGDNWPWAINFSEDFAYPLEGSNISLAYPKFLTWAQSGGTLFTDWYSNVSGYRNNAHIYQR